MERMQRFDWYRQRPREVWKLLGSRGDGNYQRSIVHCARKNGRVVATVRVVVLQRRRRMQRWKRRRYLTRSDGERLTDWWYAW